MGLCTSGKLFWILALFHFLMTLLENNSIFEIYFVQSSMKFYNIIRIDLFKMSWLLFY